MNDDVIQSLWDRGKAGEPVMSHQQLEGLLHRSAMRGWRELRRLVWFYLAVMASALVVNGMNISGYRASPVWVGVHIAMSLTIIGFLAFGAHLLRGMRRLEDLTEGLAVLVRRQLDFLRTWYRAWLWVVTAAIWLLGFAVSLVMYNQGGHYRVGIDLFLAAFVVVQVAAIHGIVLLAHRPFLQRIVAALHDVEAQVTERTLQFERGQRVRTLFGILALIVGLACLVFVLLHLLVGKGG